MRQNGSLRPTAQGAPLAKDAWLLGIGLSFVLDAISSEATTPAELARELWERRDEIDEQGGA